MGGYDGEGKREGYSIGFCSCGHMWRYHYNGRRSDVAEKNIGNLGNKAAFKDRYIKAEIKAKGLGIFGNEKAGCLAPLCDCKGFAARPVGQVLKPNDAPSVKQITEGRARRVFDEEV